MRLKKWVKNPILRPKPGSDWEGFAVCNPGAVYKEGKVYLLYRASGETETYRIYLGLATSEDGYRFTRYSDNPIYTPCSGFDSGCAEDPRIVEMEGHIYVTYACRANPYTAFITGNKPVYPDAAPLSLKRNLTRTGLLRTRDMIHYDSLGPITRDDVDDRDAILFPGKIGGRYIMLHRPSEWVGHAYGSMKPGIWMAFSEDLINWKDDILLARPEFEWQSEKIGGSAPPIKTDRGWLVLYHGVDKKRIYRQGVMLLDLEDPRRIIARPREFILEPTEEYEISGIEHDVVFAVGNIVMNNQLFVYYGGADKVCCVATAGLRELIDYTVSNPA